MATTYHPRKIYIQCLHKDTRPQDLWAAFLPLGKVTSVEVVKHRSTGQCKGYGFVQFASADTADNAIKMETHNVEGTKK